MRTRTLLIALVAGLLLMGALAQSQTPQQQILASHGATSTPTPCADFGCISGLQLWIEANAITGKSNGDALAHTDIVDTSGLSHGPTSSGGGGTITYRTNIQDGQPAIRFADAYYEFGSWASGFTAGEVWILIKLVTDPPGDISDTGLWDWGTSSDSAHFPYTDGDIYDAFGTTARKNSISASSLSSAFVVYQVSSASGAWQAWINGSSVHGPVANTVGFTSTPALGASDNRTYRLFGDVLAFVIFDKTLSGGERASGCDGLLSRYPTITCAW